MPAAGVIHTPREGFLMANDIRIIRTAKGTFARVDNPRWNKELNRRHSAKGGGHRAVAAALQSISQHHRILRVRYQPLSGKWFAEVERI